MPVPPAEVELAVLATRALLKYRFRDVVKDALAVRSPGVPIETRDEIAWLEGRTTREELRARLESDLGVLPVDPICAFLETIERGRGSGIELFRLRCGLRRALRPYRRRSYVRARLAYARGAWLRRRRLRGAAPDLRMMPAEGGTCVALVGSDGSGKSTMASGIDTWLGWKLQTRVHYMGSKQPSSRSRALYLLFRALRRTHRASVVRLRGTAPMYRPDRERARRGARAALPVDRSGPRPPVPEGSARRAFRSRRHLRSVPARAARAGPTTTTCSTARRSRACSRNRWRALPKALAAAEVRIYRQFRLPEHVVLLRVDPEVAIARKPDHLREVLVAKCDAFTAISEISGVGRWGDLRPDRCEPSLRRRPHGHQARRSGMSSEPRAHPPAAGRLPIVELIGTPGAGKTTLSTEIIELLQEGGWAASTIVGAAREHARRTAAGRLLVRHTSGRVQRLLLWWLFYVLASMHAFVFLFEERQLSRTVLGTQLRRPIRVARRVQICFWFFQLAGRQRFLRATAREREVLVVDDGFLHRAVHIYASHVEDPSPRAVGHYVDLLSAALARRLRSM